MTHRESLNDAKRQKTQKFTNDAIVIKGWSKKDIATLLNVSRSTIESWADGRTMASNAFRLALSELPDITSKDGLTLAKVKLRVAELEAAGLNERLVYLRENGHKARDEHRVSLKIDKANVRIDALKELVGHLENH